MQLGPDKEWSLIFAVFDENRSWYFNENMQKSSQNITDPGFYSSNVIYSKIILCSFITTTKPWYGVTLSFDSLLFKKKNIDSQFKEILSVHGIVFFVCVIHQAITSSV